MSTHIRSLSEPLQLYSAWPDFSYSTLKFISMELLATSSQALSCSPVLSSIPPTALPSTATAPITPGPPAASPIPYHPFAHSSSSKPSHAQRTILRSTKPNKASRTTSESDVMFINIPMRSGGKTRSQGHVLSNHHSQGFPELPEKRRSNHVRSHAQQHKGIPPAVAALLAVTSIPPPQLSQHGKRRKNILDIYVEPPTPIDAEESNNSTLETLLGLDECGEDAGLIFGSYSSTEPTTISRSSSQTAFSVLLSPPGEFDENSSCSLSIRSASSDSVPSLDNDDNDSINSDEPSPPKPSLRRSVAERRLKLVTSPSEDCMLDHPLLFKKELEAELPTASESSDLYSGDTTKQSFRRVLSFKSNLTASIRVLKSAAKSFSSFPTPLVQPDDFLTRSILSKSIPYTDEKRPRPTKEMPTPALRRYLNPTSAGQESLCTGAIQMQTYNRGARKPPPRQKQQRIIQRTDDADTPRPREIRENGDFLRVIVLEMNMRREGKLSETAHGRARVFLPPRKACRNTRIVGDLSKRWEVLCA